MIASSHQMLVSAVFFGLIVIARGIYHQMRGHWKPCWAIFFLAGVWLESTWWLVGLLGLVVAIDLLVERIQNYQRSCLSPSYLLIFPAYGCLWLGGELYKAHHAEPVLVLVPLVLYTWVAASVAELFNSGGFYFFSGHFIFPTIRGFVSRFFWFYPAYVGTAVFYVLLAAIAHNFLVNVF